MPSLLFAIVNLYSLGTAYFGFRSGLDVLLHRSASFSLPLRHADQASYNEDRSRKEADDSRYPHYPKWEQK